MNAIFPKAHDIFVEVLKLPTAAWPQFLDDACGDEPGLRKRLDDLLAAHREAGTLHPAPQFVAATNDPMPAERIGALIGPYKLLEQIGEGGMGSVYMAEQQRPVRRLVALKLIKPGMDSKQVIARFDAERQALAMMDHPNIAKVLDAGATESGHPYFVMELVRGIPINEFCDQKRLTVRHRLELFIQVCQAVQHAHQKGIIHRDLKPTNVLVTMHDTHAVPKIIDFGIAKALGGSLTDCTLYTGFAQLIGTPLYMSPEQAEMNALGVDTRSDVYSLGVMLYELLTGTTPFDKDTLAKASIDELRRVIREQEPLCPSARVSTLQAAALSTISRQRGLDEHRLRKLFHGELDWIVMKSLEKDRERRYESPSSFVADIQRYLGDEPVLACPPSPLYRLQKLARKYRAALVTTCVICLSLIVATTFSTWQAIRAANAEARSVANEAKARAEEHRAKAKEHEALAAAAAARAAKDAEAIQRKRAEANFEKARQAVDQMLTRVANDDLKGIPQMESVRSELLEQALAFYRGFLDERATDPDVRFQMAKAYQNIGRFQNRFRRLEQSEQALRQAVQIVVELAAGAPENEDYRTTWVDCILDLGLVASNCGRPDEAERLYLEGLALAEKINRDFPANPSRFPSDGAALLYLSRLQGETKRYEEGESSVRRALAIFLKEAEVNPEHVDSRPIGQCYHQLGVILLDRGRTNDAENAYRKAMEVFDKLAAKASSKTGFLQDRAITRESLALFFANTGRRTDAEQVYKECISLWQRQVSDYPQIPMYRFELARALYNFGNCRHHRTDYQQCLELLKELIAKYPEISEYHSLYGAAENNLGNNLISHDEEWANAVRLVEDAIEHQETALRLMPVAPLATNHLRVHYSSLAWYLVLAPDAKNVDARRTVELAQKAIRLKPTDGSAHVVLGAAYYRAGDWKAALPALRKSLGFDLDKNDAAVARLFLAMTQWQLGSHDDSKKNFADASERMANDRDQRHRRLHAEAAELLGVNETLDERPKQSVGRNCAGLFRPTAVAASS